MEDVTDTVFRQVLVKCGVPDIFFTEFTNVEGILSAGHKQVSQRLKFSQNEHPLVAQIWGLKPENFFKVAHILAETGFDGIDINMGCPERRVIKMGACAAMINNPHLASEIILATREGAGKLPISVKTRIGVKEIVTENWIGHLLSQKIDALTVHGRTVKEMTDVPAHWDEIKKTVDLRNKMGVDTVILGNGDVYSCEDGFDKASKSGVDGVMIGRGVFLNPWIFNPNVNLTDVTVKQRLDLLLTHTKLFVDTWGDEKNFNIMKKFFKVYVNGFEGASGLRADLMSQPDMTGVIGIISSYLNKFE